MNEIIDGKDAVTFLVGVKECLEDPRRFVLELWCRARLARRRSPSRISQLLHRGTVRDTGQDFFPRLGTDFARRRCLYRERSGLALTAYKPQL